MNTPEKRSRPGLPVYAILLGVAALAIALGVHLLGGPSRPNVLFILVDTLRRDHLHCYGYPRNTSPHIDRLAARGIRFENALAQSSWTLPSMISLMSGRYLFSEIPALPGETVNLPLLMKEKGYHTAAFIANSLVGRKEGFAKGFDHFEIREHKTPQWSGRDLNTRLLPWMGAHLEAPFFLYVHYLDPHFPYEPPEALARFPGSFRPMSEAKRARILAFLKEHPELAAGATRDLDEMVRQIDRYDGEIRAVDRSIGRLLETLDRLGYAEDTVVVLAADHGECLWDHRQYPKVVEKNVPEEKRNLTAWFFRDHGYHLFQELIHVPLIVAGPGIPPGRVEPTPVENVDLVPTLLTLAGGRDGFQGDGLDLTPLLSGRGALPSREILFSHCNEATCAILPERNFKFIAPTRTGQSFGLDYGLFDLAADPWEERNCMRDHPEAARALLQAVEGKEAQGYFKNRGGEMDQETRDKMKELGYIK